MPFEDDDEETKIVRHPSGATSLCILRHGRLVRVIADSGETCVTDRNGNVLGPVADYLNSHCGVQFDTYVRRAPWIPPFPYSSTGPAFRTVDSLWAGRRLKILPKSDGRWLEAKVVEWKQICSGPHSPATLWLLTIDFLYPGEDDTEEMFKRGDLVEMKGLKSNTQYNGKLGVLGEYRSSSGRFVVECTGGKIPTVKPSNLVRVKRFTREIGRLNIDGGGTLIGEDADVSEVLSFEWIDSAEPVIDLRPPSIEEEEFQPPDSEEEEAYYGSLSDLEAKRSANLATFAERTPSVMGPPDCNPDGTFILTPCRLAFNAYMEGFGAQLLQTSETDLLAFRRTLMEQPLLLWNNTALSFLVEKWSMDALKVIVEVLKRRYSSGCFRNMVVWVQEKYCDTIGSEEQIEYSSTMEFSKWSYNFCLRIGALYEEAGEYAKAIPWYRNALDLVDVGSPGDLEHSARSHHNLAKACKGAGFLGDALRWFNQSLSKHETIEVTAARQQLLNEIKKWTGTSGYMVSENQFERIRDSEIYKIARMEPCESGPSCFGGIPASGSSKVPTNSFYASLSRLASLPPLHKRLSKFTNRKAKLAYMTIYNGDFALEIRDGGHILVLKVAGNTVGDLMEIRFLCLNIENGDAKVSGVLDYETESLNPWFAASISEDQKLALAFRVVHLFVRSHATDSAINICEFLISKYGEREWWKEAIDSAMIRVEISFNLCLGNYAISVAYNSLGETLEACGRFEEAAFVYQEAADCYPSGPKLLASLHSHSGLAFKRADKDFHAEKQYVIALHVASTKIAPEWDLNEDFSTLIIANMLLLYDDWSKGASPGITLPTDMDMIGPLLQGLLFSAGFVASSSDFVKRLVMENGPKYVGNILDPSFASPSTAKQALVAATSTPSLEGFRSRILLCRPSNSITLMARGEGIGKSDNARKLSKQRARDDLTKNRIGLTFSKCGNPHCTNTGSDFKQCPCRSIAYCSKECQRVHWRGGHKKVCPTAKESK